MALPERKMLDGQYWQLHNKAFIPRQHFIISFAFSKLSTKAKVCSAVSEPIVHGTVPESVFSVNERAESEVSNSFVELGMVPDISLPSRSR